MSAAPTTLPPPIVPLDPEGVPAELRALPNWVAFKLTWDAAKGKYKKVPKNPRTGGNASSTDPATWGAFDAALARMRRDRLQAVGFAFAAGLGIVGADLDDCRDWRTGALTPDAREVVAGLGTYAEPSISGTGVHAVGRGTLPGPGRREAGVEMYDAGRFFLFTGRPLPDHEAIVDCQDALTALYREAFADRPARQPVERAGEDEPPVELSPAALAVWRGEAPKVNQLTGRVDRSATLVKVARVLFDAGMTRTGILPWLAERDRALGYDKYAGSPDAQEQYNRIVDVVAREGRNPRLAEPGSSQAGTDWKERAERAEARAADLAARHSRLAQALQAKGLPAAEKITLIELVLELGHAASARPEAPEHAIPLARIAERVGASQQTVSRHIDRCARLADTQTGEVVRLFDRRNVRDPITGRSHSLYRPRLSADEVLALLPRAAPIDGKPKHGHGGARPACPEHPGAKVIRRVTYHCSVCEKELGRDADDDGQLYQDSIMESGLALGETTEPGCVGTGSDYAGPQPTIPQPVAVRRASKMETAPQPGGVAEAWLNAAPLDHYTDGAFGGRDP